MKAEGNNEGTGRAGREGLGRIEFGRLRGRRSSRDLLLVRLAFWATIVVVVGFGIFMIWQLATQEPSPFRIKNSIGD